MTERSQWNFFRNLFFSSPMGVDDSQPLDFVPPRFVYLLIIVGDHKDRPIPTDRYSSRHMPPLNDQQPVLTARCFPWSLGRSGDWGNESTRVRDIHACMHSRYGNNRRNWLPRIFIRNTIIFWLMLSTYAMVTPEYLQSWFYMEQNMEPLMRNSI